MPFLVHPVVFFMFGRAVEGGGDLPRPPVYALALIGVMGMVVSLLIAAG